MAGIHVSGGTYSGSGDFTADWIQVEDSSTFYAPDGTFKLVGAGTPGGALYQLWYENNAIIYNQSGTTLFAGASIGTSYIRDAAYNTAGREYPFYNVILDDSSNSGISQTVLPFWIENDLTVKANRTLETMTNDSIKALGSVLITGTASKIDTNHASATDQEFGSLHIAAGGTYDATSGTTTINWSPIVGISDWDNRIYINNGTVVHNSGTIILNPDADTIFGGGTGAGGLWNVIATERGAGTYTYRVYDTPIIENDLTISGNVIYNNNIAGGKNHTVSGNVLVTNSGSYANTGATANTQNFGSLIVNSYSTFIASPSGQTNINGPHSGGYLWRSNAGTFTHNNGLVYINTGAYNGSDVFPAPTQPFYNLTYSGSGTVESWSSIIANNFDVGTDITFRPIIPTAAFTVSGTATMNGFFGKDGYPQTVDNTFGALDIKSGGTYYATSGTTTVGASSIPAIFDNDGTFTHNNGTVALEYGAGGDSKITGSARTTFHKLNTGFSYMYTGFVVEDTWATTADGGGATNFYDASDNWVLGTTSSTGYLVTNVGTGVKAANNVTLSGASEAYPAIVSGTKYDFHTTINTLNNVDFADAQTSDANATLVLSNVDFSGGLTTNDSTTQSVTFNSGTWVKFGGSFLPGDGTIEIVSGATVIFDGAANYLQDNAATVYGRGSATLWWDSTGYYSPNGSFTSTGFRDVFWNSEARINQDAVFRGSNLIVGGGFSAQNRAIGTSGSPPKIVIANGGTVSSSTNVFHASTFSNRGGLFTSSSAFDFDGSSGLINAGVGSSIDDIFDGGGTIEGWINLDSAGEATASRLVSKDAYFIYFHSNGQIRLQYSFNGGAYVGEWYTENGSFAYDSKWRHVAVTYDNSDVANDPSIYLDGKLLPLGTIIRPTGTRASDVGDVLYVGNNPSDIRTLEGRLGMLRIFSDIRTAAEIRTDMFNQNSDMVEKTDLELMYQFDEGQGTTVTDVSTNSNTGTITLGTSAWAAAGTWAGGNKLGSETGVVAGNLYIGSHTTNPTLFGSSYFNIDNRKLIEGSKFASKSHMGTLNYYIATSGTNDWLNYQHLTAAPIGTTSEVYILANGALRSYFNFDSDANNEQCNTLVNAGVVRIVANSDFYTQDFDNSQGEWIRSTTYDGIIHDDGSTPHEYEPIDIMDDQDSFFDTEDLID